MTCASCATRIEQKLNRLDGVTATVNFATEAARVVLPRDARPSADLIAVVERTGYTARAARAARRGAGRETAGRRRRAGSCGWRLLVSVALAVPVVLLAMVPALQLPRLAVGVAGGGDAGRDLGRVAVPPRRR